MTTKDRIQLHYKKNNNTTIFNKLYDLEIKPGTLQNFMPLYDLYFSLNETNWNKINLNHENQLCEIYGQISRNTFNVKTFSEKTDKETDCKSFVKISPLLDPVQYIVGKYSNTKKRDEPYNQIQSVLPTFAHNKRKSISKLKNTNIEDRINNPHNNAFVDSFFSYLSSKMLHVHSNPHCLDFYGSFNCIQNDYFIDVTDDIEYLMNSTHFLRYNNKQDFEVSLTAQELDYIKQSMKYKPKLNIKNSIGNLSIVGNDDLLELDALFLSNEETTENKGDEEMIEVFSMDLSKTQVDENDLNSTEDDDTDEDCDETDDTDEECDDNETISTHITNSSTHISEDEDTDSEFESEPINECIIKEFPCQMIFLEKLVDTLDNYALEGENIIGTNEWKSILLQVVFSLIIYQKSFDFTHNDLHTNNIMYVPTNKTHIKYVFNGETYIIPTFGKIYKIIDFGRAIYKFNGRRICSDSFQKNGDAFTQYNTEPFYNPKKPRIEPNKSFDLCRLGCSLFDSYNEIYMDGNLKQMENDIIGKIINKWCSDDDGKHILYHPSGKERFEGFLLYKMIARKAHNHIPEEELDQTYFKEYLNEQQEKCKDIDVMNMHVINIDVIPDYSRKIETR